MADRINGPRVGDQRLLLRWEFESSPHGIDGPATGETWTLLLSNGALTPQALLTFNTLLDKPDPAFPITTLRCAVRAGSGCAVRIGPGRIGSGRVGPGRPRSVPRRPVGGASAVSAAPLSQPPSGACQVRLPARGAACGRGGGAAAGSSA
ncbi:hypothetical protein [Streptomyces nigrescens]|uniref:hypothetical protein n=1 Tax=Streptomyces nigrescens TaxID=1920 RepID=UPI003F4CE7FD